MDGLDLLKLKEAALALRVSPSTIRLWTKEGKLQAVRVGKGCLYRRSDLLLLVERSVDQRSKMRRPGHSQNNRDID